MANEANQNIIDQLMRESHAKAQAAEAKYRPIVERLPDLEFAGLFRVVQEEAAKRRIRLIMENPVVRQMAITDIARRMGQSREDED